MRVDVGMYGDAAAWLILLIQASLGAMVAVMAVGWLYFTLTAWLDPNRSATFLFEAVPVMIGMAVAVSLLDRLYE